MNLKWEGFSLIECCLWEWQAESHRGGGGGGVDSPSPLDSDEVDLPQVGRI